MIKRLRNISGQTIVEYLIILAFIAVVAISVLIALTPDPKAEQKQKIQEAQSEKQSPHKITVTDSNPPTVYYSDGNVIAHSSYIEFYVNGHERDISNSSKFTVEETDNN